MDFSNSYEILSVESNGHTSHPWLQDMQIGFQLSIADTPNPANGYGLIHTLMHMVQTRNRLSHILEIGGARFGHTWWRNVGENFPEAKYMGFDHLNLVNLELTSSTTHIDGCWPQNASDVSSQSQDIVFHHALGPQMYPASLRDFSDEVYRVLNEGGIYIGCHSVSDSHPFMVPRPILGDSGFQGITELVVKNDFSDQPDTSWADRQIRAVIAEK